RAKMLLRVQAQGDVHLRRLVPLIRLVRSVGSGRRLHVELEPQLTADVDRRVLEERRPYQDGVEELRLGPPERDARHQPPDSMPSCSSAVVSAEMAMGRISSASSWGSCARLPSTLTVRCTVI